MKSDFFSVKQMGLLIAIFLCKMMFEVDINSMFETNNNFALKGFVGSASILELHQVSNMCKSEIINLFFLWIKQLQLHYIWTWILFFSPQISGKIKAVSMTKTRCPQEWLQMSNAKVGDISTSRWEVQTWYSPSFHEVLFVTKRYSWNIAYNIYHISIYITHTQKWFEVWTDLMVQLPLSR